MLLVNRRRVVSADQLVDGLWGEAPPASAVQSLQVYVHGLRRALGAERIETAGRGYRAAVGEEELDLDRFERGLERGRAALEAGRQEDAADELRRRSLSGAAPRSPICRRSRGAPRRPTGSTSCD
jgi:DNA-binding SARP family transcriptional activator